MNPIAYEELIEEVIGNGYVENVDLSNVNGTSIDIVLGPKIQIEVPPELKCPNCGHPISSVKPNQLLHTLANEAHALQYCLSCGLSAPLIEWLPAVDFSKKQPLSMKTVDISEKPYCLAPGEVCLAHSVEIFNLPMHITAEFRLKSSQARVFLEHLHAAWCDPGWHGSALTLEFVNLSRFHRSMLVAGKKCGQVMFYRHKPVPHDKSYAVRGQYNNIAAVAQSKGVK